MGSYHAEVINLSLKDKKMIKKFPVLKCQNRFLVYAKYIQFQYLKKILKMK